MKKIIYFIMLLFLPFIVAAASYYVDDPSNCPVTNGTTFPGQSCSPTNICGNDGGTAQCYDTSTLTAPVGTASSTTLYSSSINGGYVVNCFADVDASSPFCDNSGNYWCNRDNTCQNTYYRQTTCLGGSFGSSECGSCLSGRQNCTGAWDVCEVVTGSTSCPSGQNNHYVSSCGCECDTGYLNCSSVPNANPGCNIQIDVTVCDPGDLTKNCVIDGSCGVSCESGYNDCDGFGANFSNGCEIQDGASCNIGSIIGVYDGCSGSLGNCVISPMNHTTGRESVYSTANANLWTHQYGTGVVANFTNSTNASILIDQTSCIVFSDGSQQCTSASGEVNNSWNQSTAEEIFYLKTIIDSFFTSLPNLTLSQIVDNIGNWTSDKINYYTKTEIDANPHNYTNVTLTNASPIGIDSNIINLIPCPDTQVYAYNLTLGGWECQPKTSAGGGTVTSVAGDGDYVLGIITTAGAFEFNETRLNFTIDDRASGAGDNASWNESYAFTLFLNRTSEALYITTFNATYDAKITDNESWNEGYAFSLFLNRTSEALYLSTFNITYDAKVTDNQSWNESYANTLYYPIDDNPHNYTNITLTNASPIGIDSDTINLIPCPDTMVYAYNLSATEWQCQPKLSAGGGTVTSVAGDGEYVIGIITTAGQFIFNETKLNLTIDARAVEADNSSWNETRGFKIFLNRTSEPLYTTTFNGSYDIKVTDNQTWNQTAAETLFYLKSIVDLIINGNMSLAYVNDSRIEGLINLSWNQTKAEELFYPIDSNPHEYINTSYVDVDTLQTVTDRGTTTNHSLKIGQDDAYVNITKKDYNFSLIIPDTILTIPEIQMYSQDVAILGNPNIGSIPGMLAIVGDQSLGSGGNYPTISFFHTNSSISKDLIVKSGSIQYKWGDYTGFYIGDNVYINGNLNVTDNICISGECIDEWDDVNISDTNDTGLYYPNSTVDTIINNNATLTLSLAYANDTQFINNTDISVNNFNVSLINLSGVSITSWDDVNNTNGNESWNESYAYTLFLNRSSESLYITTFNSTYDAKISNNETFNQTLTNNLYVNIIGDTMTGKLNIQNDLEVTGKTELGDNNTASGTNSLAVGKSSIALGNNSLAIGYNNNATGLQSVALGSSTVSSGFTSVAIGYKTIASGNNSFSGGDESKAKGKNSVALGEFSEASSTDSIAIGYKANSTTAYSTAIGSNTKSNGLHSIAIGNSAIASGNNAIALRGTASGNSAFSYRGTASDYNSIAIGIDSKATDEYAIAIGREATASGETSTAIGYKANATGQESVSLGYQTQSIGRFSLATGYKTKATSIYSTAIGRETNAEGTTSFATGQNTNASGTSSTAIGYYTKASGDYATAMGIYTKATNWSSMAIGQTTHASGYVSFAVGESTNASGDYAIAMGTDIKASGEHTIAIGLKDTTIQDCNNSNTMCIMGGKVGIEITNPKYELDVDGDINVSGTIYYGALQANSPHMFNPDESGYTRFCIFDTEGYWNLIYWEKGEQKVIIDNVECLDKKTKLDEQKIKKYKYKCGNDMRDCPGGLSGDKKTRCYNTEFKDSWYYCKSGWEMIII